MHKKARRLVMIILAMGFVLSACNLSKGYKGQSKNVEEDLLNMDGYFALVEISSIDIDSEKRNVYQAKQLYEIDGSYRFEVTSPEHISGLTTIYNGHKVIQYNPNVDQPTIVELPNNEFRNQIFLGTFIKNYLQSKNVSIEVQNIGEGANTILQAIIPGGSRHMSSQKLWISQESKKPVRMIIYNSQDQETVLVEFMEFAYNPKTDESMFTIEK